MSARRAFAGTAVAVIALAAVPWSDGPLRRLAGGEGDGRDPQFDVAIDPHTLRQLARDLPEDSSYATLAPDESPLVQGNLKAAAQLYLARQLAVQDATRADVVLGYRLGRVIQIAPR